MKVDSEPYSNHSYVSRTKGRVADGTPPVWRWIVLLFLKCPERSPCLFTQRHVQTICTFPTKRAGRNWPILPLLPHCFYRIFSGLFLAPSKAVVNGRKLFVEQLEASNMSGRATVAGGTGHVRSITLRKLTSHASCPQLSCLLEALKFLSVSLTSFPFEGPHSDAEGSMTRRSSITTSTWNWLHGTRPAERRVTRRTP